MSTTLDEVIDGIADTLKTIPGLVVIDHIPGTTDYPCAFFHPVPSTDDRDGGVADQTHDFEIIVLVSQSLYEAQRTVLPYLERSGAQSIFAAFENNRSLGGLAGVDALKLGHRPLNDQEVAGYHGSGAAVTIRVFHSAD